MESKYQSAIELGCGRHGDERKRRNQKPLSKPDEQYTLAHLSVSSTSLPLDSGRRDDLRKIAVGLKQTCMLPGVDVRVLQFPEVLSSSNQSAVKRVFRDVHLILSLPAASPVVLNLTSVRICGADFIDGLIASKSNFEACSANVVIAGDPHRLLSLFQVQRLVTIYPNLHAALSEIVHTR